MKVFRVGAIALLAMLCSVKTYSQGEIPVDMHTGTPSIFIPLWRVTGHDLGDMVGVSYNSTGLKLEETTGQVGAGWSLQAGGSIMREVRGLPDDYQGNSPDTRKGWLYGTVASDINSFSTTADTVSSTCTDENSINTTFNTYNFTIDTEPDIYHFTTGSVSGSFVFDNSLNIRLLTYQDVKIEHTFDTSPSKKILSFKITTNDGVSYVFDNRVTMTRKAYKLISTAVEFQKRDFAYYDNNTYTSGLPYTSEWKLSQVNSPSGAFLKYKYASTTFTSSNTVRVGIRKLTSSALVDKPIYRIDDSGSLKSLSSIASSDGDSIVFVADDVTSPIEKVIVYDKRENPAYVKEFVFTYADVGSLSTSVRRVFLKSITEQTACEKLPPYQFTYISVDFVNSKCELPDINSSSKDFWGYYNGRTNTHPYPKLYVYPSEPLSQRFRLYPIPGYGGTSYTLDGADRTPDATKMQIGSLETIKYPEGGIFSFNYEPDDFYDTKTSTNVTGGGLRIKSISYFDGVNLTGRIIKNFEYKEGTNSSGRLISYPAFAIPTKQYVDPENGTVKTYSQLSTNQEKYEHLIVRSDQDLNQSLDRGMVGYRHVKVSRPNAGYVEFDFFMPAFHGSGSSGQWVQTENKFVRPSACPSMDIVLNGGRSAFPYSPDPNFQYERGFMTKKTEWTETGVKVRESTYTPQYVYKSGSTPAKVWGVAYDYYANSSTNVYFYGKYFLLTDVAKALSIESVVNYDAADVNKNATVSTQYYYASSAHKLLSKTVSTSADGTLVTTEMKYPLDYGTIQSNSDVYLKTIGTLQTTFRNGSPVEVKTSIQRSGESEKVVAASLVKFSDFGITGKVLPYQQLSLKIDQGITNFTNSGQTLQSSTYVLTSDSRYQVDATFSAYDTYNRLLSSIGKSRTPVSTYWGYKKSVPVVQATNANYNEFAFSDFETDADSMKTGQEFSLSAKYYGAGRTGNKALQSNLTMTKILQKPATGVTNYKLSFWLKKGVTSIDFTLRLKNTAGTTTYYTSNFTVTPATTAFEYVEKLIPVTSAPSSFLVELVGNSGASLIDEVAFYPEIASLISYTYDFPYGAVTITDASASTAYVVLDGLGRERFVKDKDGNIIKKNTYKFSSIQPVSLTAAIKIGANTYATDSPIDPIYLNDLTLHTFTASDDNCVTDITYEWDFGDGAGYQTLGKVATYTYTTTGSKTIKLRKSHPINGTVVRSIPVTIILRPLVGTICAKGAEIVECTTVTSTYACAAITDTPTGINTIYKVTGIDVGETMTAFSWERSNGSGGWTVVGTSIQSPSIAGSVSYEIRCLITTSTGRTGYSDSYTVTKEICH